MSVNEKIPRCLMPTREDIKEAARQLLRMDLEEARQGWTDTGKAKRKQALQELADLDQDCGLI